MGWNYRIIQYDEQNNGFGLHEVYYKEDNDDHPWMYTEKPVGFVANASEGPEAIKKKLLELAVKAFDKPVLLESSFPKPADDEEEDAEDAKVSARTGEKLYTKADADRYLADPKKFEEDEGTP